MELHNSEAGPGFAEANRDRVFEPFFRGSIAEENVGSGPGLSLIRQISRHHAGDANCIKRTDGGTEFVVRVPRFRPS